MKKIIRLFVLFIVSVAFAQENNPLLFGNPSGAVTDFSSSSNYLLIKDEYTLSYNNSTYIPNWVCWHLCKDDLGDSGRSNKFFSDNALPENWYHVTAQDYQYSVYGFDRGHVCPSADRTATVAANNVTFLMSNMIPQSPDCNRIVWMHMENFERELVEKGNEVYIFAGPAGVGGEGIRGIFEEILVITKLGESLKIKVPAWSWKIMLVMPEGDDDFRRVCESLEGDKSGQIYTVAACIPNKQGCQFDENGNKIDWDSYKCSIDYIENLTGYNFFDLLPDEIENKLEE